MRPLLQVAMLLAGVTVPPARPDIAGRDPDDEPVGDRPIDPWAPIEPRRYVNDLAPEFLERRPPVVATERPPHGVSRWFGKPVDRSKAMAARRARKKQRRRP